MKIKPYLQRMYRDGCRGQQLFYKWIEYGIGEDGKRYDRSREHMRDWMDVVLYNSTGKKTISELLDDSADPF